MNKYHNEIMIYMLKETVLNKNVNKDFIHNFIKNFNENLNKCEICNNIIFQCKYLQIDNHKKILIDATKNLNHQCIICKNAFECNVIKNSNNKLIDILKKTHRYYNFDILKCHKNSYFQLYMDLFKFINDFVLYLTSFDNELILKLKQNVINKEKLIHIMCSCEFLNNLIGYIIKEEEPKKISCRCELCTIKINEKQASKLTKIVFDNILMDNYKNFTLNDYLLTKQISRNYRLYFKNYILEIKVDI